MNIFIMATDVLTPLPHSWDPYLMWGVIIGVAVVAGIGLFLLASRK